jgi:hypothetical protein
VERKEVSRLQAIFKAGGSWFMEAVPSSLHGWWISGVICTLSAATCWAAAAEGRPNEAVSWLTGRARELLKGCQVKAKDGTSLYTPDGKGNYAALWTRDYSYMVENAFDLMPREHTPAAIRYLLAGQREDGCIPDRRQPDGVSVYSAGPANAPVAAPPLDNSAFMVFLVADYVDHTDDLDFFRPCARPLIRAMDYIPRSEAGLVWNDPKKPHSPYGFTDCIGKTGEQCFDSLLYWRACGRLSALVRKTGDGAAAAEMDRRAELIVKNITRLWDDAAGGFLAASIDCRQLDVWANAYAIYIDFPLGDRRGRVLKMLHDACPRYVWHGQIRHLLKGEYWQRTLAPVQRDRYQNGAYWATASGWVIYALAQVDRDLVLKTIDELIADFRADNICECVGPGYRQLPDYVASGTNALGALRRVMQVGPFQPNVTTAPAK